MYSRAEGIDAIDEYSRRLVGALSERGVAAQYVDDGLSSARRQVADPPWISFSTTRSPTADGGSRPDSSRRR